MIARRTLSFIIAVMVLPNPVFADTVRLTTQPDQNIAFDVSVTGPTRISVVDNRISKILQSSSNFEMVNDEGTGDVFLRFAGGQPTPESGYIVTETGHTIGFTMTPKTDLQNHTVLVTLRGVSNTASSAATDASQAAAGGGFAVNSGGAGSSRTAQLVQFARQAYATRIGNRAASGQRVGNFATYSARGLIARISVASASNGQIPSERQFYQSSRTLAVYVDRVISGGKIWVIVVEGTR
jgi:hypothetical protein